MAMFIKIPADKDFDFYACRKLYKKYQKLVGDDASFNKIIKNAFFYSFYDNKTLVGCIYIYKKKKKLYINGFAIRKFYEIKYQALNKIFDWFDCDIYAESIRKPAIYMLYQCGFEKISENLFVHRKNGFCRKGL